MEIKTNTYNAEKDGVTDENEMNEAHLVEDLTFARWISAISSSHSLTVIRHYELSVIDSAPDEDNPKRIDCRRSE